MSGVTEASFLKEVAKHQMKVLHDDGLYRHLRYSAPGSWCMGFEIVTWPGSLAYTGDMGCFVFSRVADMLTFFRGSESGPLRINLSYWSEKLDAVDGTRGGGAAKVFSERRFIAAVARHVREWTRNNREDTTRQERRDLWEAVKDEVLGADGDSGGFRMQAAANDFSHKVNDTVKDFCFQDFWEHDLTEYTPRFVWCCYALAWAIRQYDVAKACKPSPAVEAAVSP